MVKSFQRIYHLQTQERSGMMSHGFDLLERRLREAASHYLEMTGVHG